MKAVVSVVGFPYDGYWQDLGLPDDYQRGAAEFDQMKVQFLGGKVDEVASPAL